MELQFALDRALPDDVVRVIVKLYKHKSPLRVFIVIVFGYSVLHGAPDDSSRAFLL